MTKDGERERERNSQDLELYIINSRFPPFSQPHSLETRFPGNSSKSSRDYVKMAHGSRSRIKRLNEGGEGGGGGEEGKRYFAEKLFNCRAPLLSHSPSVSRWNSEREFPSDKSVMMTMMNANLFSFTDRCSRFCAAARAQLPDRGSIPLSTSGFRWKQVGERERHSAKKFLSDDLHVEANDRKSRFMSFTLMLTLWPLTYHFFPHRWKLRRACIQPHASWRCHDARGRDTINRENSSENRLIIGQPRERKLSRAIEFFYFSNKIRKFIDLISIQSFARILIWIYIYIYIFRSNCLSWKL